jgi:hypothetical protein
MSTWQTPPQNTRPGKHTKSELENGPVEIVFVFSLIAWWIFPSFFVNVYQRVSQLGQFMGNDTKM